MKIGIFDSGKGGQFVADGLKPLLPNDQLMIINDIKNMPYGNKTEEQVIKLTDQALQSIINICPIIVIACNTATVSAIKFLRQKYPQTKFIGLEPMIKPAAKLTKNKHITLLATNVTNNSQRTKHLIQKYAKNIIVDQPNLNNWAELIEHDKLAQLDYSEVKQSIDNGSDVLILGCTHYIVLKNKLEKMFPKTEILEPTEAIYKQIQRLK